MTKHNFMKILKRKIPKVNNTSYSLKQMIELNCIIMQAFLLEPLTNKEKDILVWYCYHYSSDKTVFSKDTKEAVLKSSGLKNIVTLNEYNKRLRNKRAFIYVPSIRSWTINPIFLIPKDIDSLELTITINKRNALDR